MPASSLPALWHLEISHYNEKVRWALDYKRVAHTRRAVMPGMQEFRARRLGAGRTVPILQLEGQTIRDSTRIIEEVERRWPTPPLYPSDFRQRERALELEEYFDENCGADIRRVLFADNLSEPEKFLEMLYGARHPRLGLLRLLGPVLDPRVRRRYELTSDHVARSRDVVLAALQKIERETASTGYLVGDSFTVADLTAASILAVLVVPAEFPYINLPPDERAAQFREFRDSLKGSAGFKWVENMYARHRGRSAEVGG